MIVTILLFSINYKNMCWDLFAIKQLQFDEGSKQTSLLSVCS